MFPEIYYNHKIVAIIFVWIFFSGIGGWLKVDLGKTKKITAISVQSGSYWNWVTGYHLYYSDDGKNWKGFKDVGADKWTVCYKIQISNSYPG